MKGLFLFDSSDRLVLNLCHSDLKLIFQRQLNGESDSLDSNIISHLLLPLVIAHKVYSVIAEDLIHSVASESAQFVFCPYGDRQFLLIYDVVNSRRRNFICNDTTRLKVLSDFVFGSLSDSLTERSFPEQFELLSQILTVFINDQIPPQLQLLDLANIRHTKSLGLVSLLDLLNQEMTTFVDVQVGMIIEEGQLVALKHEKSTNHTISPRFLHAIIQWSNGVETLDGVQQGLFFATNVQPVDVFVLELSGNLRYILVGKVLNDLIIGDMLQLKQHLQHPTNDRQLITEVDKVLSTLKSVLDQSNSGALTQLLNQWNLVKRDNLNRGFSSFCSTFGSFVVQFLRVSQRTGVNYRKKVVGRCWNRLSSGFRVKQILDGCTRVITQAESYSLTNSTYTTTDADPIGILYINVKDNYSCSIPSRGEIANCLTKSVSYGSDPIATIFTTDQFIVIGVTSAFLRSKYAECLEILLDRPKKSICNLRCRCLQCYSVNKLLPKLLETTVIFAVAFHRSTNETKAYKTTVSLALRWISKTQYPSCTYA